MYSQINIIKKVEPAAEKFILDNDRMLYLPFFERAEKFCAENNVLLGGRVGIDLLVGRGVTKDSFTWDLYCDDTFNTAKSLADALSRANSPHVPARTVALSTNIRHKEFTLSVNARVLFKIYSMDRYRGLKLADLMGPAVRTSYFTKEPIKLISEEMQLIEIYRTLYTPKKMSMWEDELEAESKIYGMIQDSLGDKAASVVTPGAVGSGDRFNKQGAEDVILRKVVSAGNCVLVGDHALHAMGLAQTPSRLQFITSDTIDSVARSVERALANDVRKVRARAPRVTFVRYPLNIPSDFQIAKYTLYANTGRDQTPIADVFNSTQYEMIPYWTVTVGDKKTRAGNPWVLLRFLLIDTWVLKLILNIGTDNPDFIKNRIKSIITLAGRVRTLALETAASDPTKVFQLRDYAGNYIDENVAKKKLIKEIGERFAAYYPAKTPQGGDEITPAHATTLAHAITPATTPALPRFEPLYVSAPPDLSTDRASKVAILQKIVDPKLGANADILSALRSYHGSAREYSRWGVNKSVNKFFHKNARLVPFIPKRIDTYLDIGCGDGLDIAAVKTRYRVAEAICADVQDNRDDKYKGESKMLTIEIGKPMQLPDASVDFATMFHVIHHCEDAATRLADIARVMKSGSVLLLKDHDVRSSADAGNVDFEHLTYEAGTADTSSPTLDEMLERYHEMMPMYYYSSDQVELYMSSLGFERIFHELLPTPTRIYNSAFRKRAH